MADPRAAEALAAVAPGRLRRALADPGIVLDFGAFRIRLRTRIRGLAARVAEVYAHHRFATDPCFVDTTIDVRSGAGARRWVRPLATLEVDGIDPFGPFPAAQLVPHLEWGINWAFANMMNAHLLLHAGTVEIAGRGVLLVAPPGSGKSTLTAGLVARGARLLSDEFGVVRLDDTMLLPMAKPIALKNRSIERLRAWWPQARIGRTYANTRKGDLAHLPAPAEALDRADAPARPDLVIFPQWLPGAASELLPVAEARAFLAIAANSFNYDTLGPAGFEAVARLVELCRCRRFTYATLDDAVATVFRLCDQTSPTLVGDVAPHRPVAARA